MNTSELRLGNLLHHKGALIVVSDLHKNGVIEFNEESESGFWNDKNESCEPILITEDWLEKFGFEKRMLNGTIPEWRIVCTPKNYKNEYCLAFRFGMLKPTPKGICDENSWYPMLVSGNSHGFDIKYVHELQNVYYFISKRELELKIIETQHK